MMRHNSMRGQNMMSPEIHELDLELQLLKRKRQLLQQQQDLLIGGHQNNRQRQRDYNYDQSSQMYNQQQQSQDFDFSNLYDDRNTGSGNRGRQFGQKRHAVDSWDSNVPPKRFQGSRGQPRNATGPRANQGFSSRRGGSNLRQQSDRPQPLRNIDARPNTGNRNASRPSHSMRGVRRDFQPSKVAKPKAVSPPNRLDSYPRSERRRLISKTTAVDDESCVLSPDKPATPTQSGRMELALGNILKDLRQDFSSNEKYSDVFQSERLLKVIKQSLRDRIRSVMIGQPITGMKIIIEKYREKYPRESDQEIVDTAMEVAFVTRHENKLAIRLIESEVPETYFRINMGKLLDLKLREMFKKLEEIYAKENAGNVQDIIDAQVPADPITDNIAKEDKDKYDPNDAFQNADITNESASESINETVTSNKDNDIAEDKNGDVEPQVDGTPSGETADLTDNNVVQTAEDAGEPADNTDNKSAEKDSSKLEDISNNEELQESDATFVRAWKSYNRKYFTADFYDRLINKSLSYKLPRLLPKYKDIIIKILDMDKQYKTTKATISEKVSNSKPEGGRLPINHYVKIVGRPGLPRRKLMSKFLEDYNPLTIKKHKTVHNLLFVGFHHKEDFDKILAASGSRIGNVTLTIAVSEWKNQSKSNKDETTEPESQSANETGEKDKSLVNEDLDSQITDLLSSIDKEASLAKNDNKADENLEENIDQKVKDEPVGEKKEADIEVKSEAEKSDGNKTVENQSKTANDEQVEEIKADAKKTAPATPTRSSTRLATSTPSGITTRRTSKLS